jgi:amino acid transporter, AAT family
VTRIFGLGAPAVGLTNLYALPGGFFPHGFHGTWMAVILALLSFSGVEVIAVTAAEVPHPEKTIPAALRTMTLRLFLFYVLALGVVAAIIPWTQTGGSVTVAESPFVKILALTGIPHAAGLMNFVIISAALSGMNTNVYLCARMLFSLSRGRYAPRFLGQLSKAGAPVMATLCSGLLIFLAIGLARFTPRAYAYLQGIALFSIIIVWMLILVSHLRFRRVHRAQDLPVRMPFFPVMQIVGLAILSSLLLTMAFDPDWRLSWIVGVPWLGFLIVAYFLWRKVAAQAG